MDGWGGAHFALRRLATRKEEDSGSRPRFPVARPQFELMPPSLLEHLSTPTASSVIGASLVWSCENVET